MAGFASRKGLSQGVVRPLHVRALLLEQRRPDGRRSRAAIVSADLLNWGVEQVPGIRAEIERRFGVPQAAVALAATHSHSGPQTSRWAAPSVGVADRAYLGLLERRLTRALEQAEDRLEPVVVRRARGRHDLGVNRRRELDGRPRDPDPEGPRDPIMTAVELASRGGESKAVLLHTTCHPVINAGMWLTDEYPGAATCAVEQGRGTVALFLQGCCGDINPRGVDRAGPEEAERAGAALGRIVLDALDGHAEELPPCELAARGLQVSLPFRSLPDRRALGQAAASAGVLGEWGRAFTEHPDRLAAASLIELQRLRIAAGLELLTMNAEVSVEYGLWIRQRWAGVALPVAYSNGMVGYTPTSKQLEAGGYESDASALYYLLPGRYSPDIEWRIKEGITRLMERSMRAEEEA
jgi:hypothetical protein